MPSDRPTGTVHPAQVTGGQRRVGGRGDVQVTEDRVPHGCTTWGDPGEPGEPGQSGGPRAERVERTGQEEQWHHQHLGQRHERLYLRYPCRHHYAECGEREGQRKKLTHYREDENGIVLLTGATSISAEI